MSKTTTKSEEAPAANDTQDTKVTISAPSIETAQFNLIGTAPYVQLKFSEKAKHMMLEEMSTPPAAGGKKKERSVRNYEEEFEAAQYRDAVHGWNGIPAHSFRAAAIRACSLCGYQMTKAKCSIFVVADGFDIDGYPLVKIDAEPELSLDPVRLQGTKTDIRTRAKFWPWTATVTMEYDTDQFTLDDVSNLMMRIGRQVGIGEGRPNSKGSSSAGMGWGTFALADH